MKLPSARRVGPVITVVCQWEPHDLWVGMYWTEPVMLTGVWSYRVYICLVPGFPVVLSWVGPR